MASINKKPFCKVCFDAGKNSNHPLRNEKGQTVCTYLLSLFCKNCGKVGHTISYCTMILNKKNLPPKQSALLICHKTTSCLTMRIPENRKQENRVCIIREEETKEEKMMKQLQKPLFDANFPQLMSPKNLDVPKKSSHAICIGWSKVVGKTVKVYETLSEEQEEDSRAEKKVQEEQEPQQQEQEHKQQEQEHKRQQQEQERQQQEQEHKRQQQEISTTLYSTYSSWADCD
jgi:hypothetical protein